MEPIKDITVYPKKLLFNEGQGKPVIEVVLSYHAQMRIKERFGLGLIADKTFVKHLKKAVFITGHSRPDRLRVLLKYRCQEILYVVLKDLDMILLLPKDQNVFVTAYRLSTCPWAKQEMKDGNKFLQWTRGAHHLHLVKREREKKKQALLAAAQV